MDLALSSHSSISITQTFASEMFYITSKNFAPFNKAFRQFLGQVNTVVTDERNVQRLQNTTKWLSSINYFKDNEADAACILGVAIHFRGKSEYYDTQLRLLEKRRAQMWDPETKKLLQDMADWLRQHGAKSLHLFPVKGLPGYVKGDMNEWHKYLAEKETKSKVEFDIEEVGSSSTNE